MFAIPSHRLAQAFHKINLYRIAQLTLRLLNIGQRVEYIAFARWLKVRGKLCIQNLIECRHQI